MSDNQVVVGIHAAMALLQKRSGRVDSLWVEENRKDVRMRELLKLAHEKRITVEPRGRADLDRAAAGGVHQGVVLHLKVDRVSNESDLDELLIGLDRPPLLLVLDGVTDPHNLGACLRSANGSGVDAVIVPKDKSAPLNATAAKVACGAAEYTPLIRVTNLARTLEHLKAYNIWIVGTCGEAKASLYDSKLTGGLALVMGAEDKGMRRLTREHCDHLMFIPMAGEVSSLNVSVATGVCLFEAVRQRSR